MRKEVFEPVIRVVLPDYHFVECLKAAVKENLGHLVVDGQFVATVRCDPNRGNEAIFGFRGIDASEETTPFGVHYTRENCLSPDPEPVTRESIVSKFSTEILEPFSLALAKNGFLFKAEDLTAIGCQGTYVEVNINHLVPVDDDFSELRVPAPILGG